MKNFVALILTAVTFYCSQVMAQGVDNQVDVSKWRAPSYDDTFFKDHLVNGQDALNYWMQSYNWRSNPDNLPEKKSRMELLQSNNASDVALANKQIQRECRTIMANVAGYQSRNPASRAPNTWIELGLRVPDKLLPETKTAIISTLNALNLSGKTAGYIGLLNVPGANGANVHGYLTALSLAPRLVTDNSISSAGLQGMKNELDNMNNFGDQGEFNLLESHWGGVASWNIIEKYSSDPVARRMARLISERLWINRYLTWSAPLQRITGPGSRMAPKEWLGSDNERALFATSLDRPIWLNLFFNWDKNIDPKAFRQSFEVIPTEAALPELPPYLQDIAWNKSLPNLLQCTMNYKTSTYPVLAGVKKGDANQPHKYVNYQTSNYTIGSTTNSFVTNTSVLAASVWWNNSRSSSEPLGSPKRFCVLYPHYVINGMSAFDKGDVYFENAPDKNLSDETGGVGGPWYREFADYGRVGTLQSKNKMIISYVPKPGVPRTGGDFVKSKVTRASAAMFLFRWEDSLDGLYINNKPVKSLPAQLNPGEWWFIEDGDVYAAVLPLKNTCFKGDCKITLEKRAHQIVLYQDNLSNGNIENISNEDWYNARSGFVVEAGNKDQYGSFANFQKKMMAAKVVADDANGFDRHIDYKRDTDELDMRWNSYTEQYASRKINGSDDSWMPFVSSPEFTSNNTGTISLKDATLKTDPGNSLWLLSCKPSKTWVAYQANLKKVLPIDFITPVCEIKIAQFPLGKIVINEQSAGNLKIDIDANYFANQNAADISASINLKTNSSIKNIDLSINGVPFESSSIKKVGPDTFIVQPTDKVQQIKQALIDQLKQ
ncbi:hypothetical protein SAMN05216464_10290 [Mucilaginibacter pineti]|uniref:Uncharacterized protein n=1 Tax=Mucilaginibacter pineti TaxID=1391627 RepID=A0A1G6W8I8_9SPHI|nr:hypothetical protein [Mucilaginibacter pineti]SDD62003.1 hypothetical protein SAMN05216464_10290 [Mucilaginibacter pineti]